MAPSPPPRRRSPRPRRPRASQAARAARAGGRRRIRLLLAVVMAGLALLGGRAAFLGVVKADELTARGQSQRQDTFTIPAARGTILARDGRELAADRPVVDVTATPYLIADPVDAAQALAPRIDRDPNELVHLLDGEEGYVVLAEDVPPRDAARAQELGLEGVDFTDAFERVIPQGVTASQVVGLTDTARTGLTGLELAYDQALSGRSGRRSEAQDPIGRPLEVLEARDPVAGLDVRTTIDSAIQEHAEQVLARTVEETEAQSAMAIVMRPQDGAILAMANVPTFDPTQREEIEEGAQRNRVVTDVFEPGSTFKVVTVAGALEEGLVEPGSTFYLPTEIRTEDTRGEEFDRVLRDSHPREAITATVSEILSISSNIGTVLIAQELGRERLEEWINRFGFLAPTGVDFPGEVAGIEPQWSPVSITNVPIGQGIGVTLVQLARAYAIIANGGHGVTPHLVQRVGGEPVAPEPGERVLSALTAGEVTEMLRGVVDVEEGTGANAAVAGYEVAGKTGTANKIDPETGEYSHELYTASFVGYVPADDPQLLIAVVVDEPNTEIAFYGGDVAAPDFAEIAAFSLRRLGIAP